MSVPHVNTFRSACSFQSSQTLEKKKLQFETEGVSKHASSFF